MMSSLITFDVDLRQLNLVESVNGKIGTIIESERRIVKAMIQ